MTTVILYTVVTLVVAAALFALSVAVFGRSEVLPAVAPGHTLTRLPEGGATGEDIRALRFGMVARGYDMREVDWALEQAADEIDRLRARLGESAGGGGTRPVVEGERPTAPASSAEGPGDDGAAAAGSTAVGGARGGERTARRGRRR